MHGNQSEAVLSYLAGLFDGEGCIHINKCSRMAEQLQSRNIVYTYELTVQMTDKKAVEFFQETFGGSVNERIFPDGDNRCLQYRWRITSRKQTEKILRRLLPYLRIKKKPAIFMLRVIKSWRSYKSGISYNKKISLEEMKRREESYRIMRKFNARGARATTEREEAERLSDSLSWLETIRGDAEELPRLHVV